MKCCKPKKLIIKLKFWKFILSELFIFNLSLVTFIGVGLVIWGFGIVPVLMHLLVHYLYYRYNLQKFYKKEVLPEFVKIGESITILIDRKEANRN